MTQLFIAANVLLLAGLYLSITGRRPIFRAVCSGLTSLSAAAGAALLIALYNASGGPDAGRELVSFYLPVAAYALAFLAGALLLLKSFKPGEAE